MMASAVDDWTSARGRDAPAFGVYVHWPFCAQKCPYCDFNSHVRFHGWDEDRFLAAYLRELDFVAAEVGGNRTVSSVFFGGGTPSLMKPATTAAILDKLAQLWPMANDVEITLEANPGSVEASRFQGFRAAGINRVSIGVQSLRDDQLKRLGRIHTAAEAIAAVRLAETTFDRYSFDLIYARPGQSPGDWRIELAEALKMAGGHVSLYQLTIEPDTPFAALHAAGKLVVPDDDGAAVLYDITQEMTESRGLLPYEISNHARPGDESRHNLVYWRYGEYAGVGPGAHGRLVADGERRATVAERNPERWCDMVEGAGHGYVEQAAISPSEQADELLLMGLRLREGVSLSRLAELGVRPSPQTIERLCDLGLVETRQSRSCIQAAPRIVGNWRSNELETIDACVGPGLRPAANDDVSIRATPRGRFVLNAVVAAVSSSFEATAAPSEPDRLQSSSQLMTHP